MKNNVWLLIGFFLLFSCKKDTASPEAIPDPSPEPVTAGTFAKRADVSWATEMESAGRNFYNRPGTVEDLFGMLRNLGMNVIRLRVWANPANGWNNKADLVAKAVRAKKAGLRVMVNFHYNDSWADPGKPTVALDAFR